MNDLQHALCVQRNKHADDAAELFAELMKARREISELQRKVTELESVPSEEVAPQRQTDAA